MAQTTDLQNRRRGFKSHHPCLTATIDVAVCFSDIFVKPPNGTRFSRREAVGWKRRLGGILQQCVPLLTYEKSFRLAAAYSSGVIAPCCSSSNSFASRELASCVSSLFFRLPIISTNISTVLSPIFNASFFLKMLR